MRGLTDAERDALIGISGEDNILGIDNELRDWPWPESVIDKLERDGRVETFVCEACSEEFDTEAVHVDITELGAMALRLSSILSHGAARR